MTQIPIYLDFFSPQQLLLGAGQKSSAAAAPATAPAPAGGHNREASYVSGRNRRWRNAHVAATATAPTCQPASQPAKRFRRRTRKVPHTLGQFPRHSGSRSLELQLAGCVICGNWFSGPRLTSAFDSGFPGILRLIYLHLSSALCWHTKSILALKIYLLKSVWLILTFLKLFGISYWNLCFIFEFILFYYLLGLLLTLTWYYLCMDP